MKYVTEFLMAEWYRLDDMVAQDQKWLDYWGPLGPIPDETNTRARMAHRKTLMDEIATTIDKTRESR